jgi:hypothetical protein
VVAEKAMIRELAVLEIVGPLDHLIHVDVAKYKAIRGRLYLRAGASLASHSVDGSWANRGGLEHLP